MNWMMQTHVLLHITINAFNLKHKVNIPTHNLGHILDLIITETSDEYEVAPTYQITGL